MNPVLAEVYRNDIVESCHRGSVVVVNSEGETVFALGDIDRNIYPRSSLKMFQAIPLLESGAADQFDMSDKEIALSCASHNAEVFHTSTTTKWLSRIGLNISDLECGADYPILESEKFRMIKAQQPPSRVHHNCSGKHTGMLTLAKQLGVSSKGYSDYDHPTQTAWMDSLSELLDIDVRALKWERDGCGLPAICMPIERLAYGCALFANPQMVGGTRQIAMMRIMGAIQMHPEMIAGTDRCCSEVIKISAGTVIVKTGAEAVYIGTAPDLGLGFALKIDDGATRGSEVALGALLKHLNAINDTTYQQLINYFEPTIYNSQKKATGKIIASSIWENVKL